MRHIVLVGISVLHTVLSRRLQAYSSHSFRRTPKVPAPRGRLQGSTGSLSVSSSDRSRASSFGSWSSSSNEFLSSGEYSPPGRGSSRSSGGSISSTGSLSPKETTYKSQDYCFFQGTIVDHPDSDTTGHFDIHWTVKKSVNGNKPGDIIVDLPNVPYSDGGKSSLCGNYCRYLSVKLTDEQLGKLLAMGISPWDIVGDNLFSRRLPSPAEPDTKPKIIYTPSSFGHGVCRFFPTK
ncbi:hypothetical protein FOZ63_020558 [Perkinsus olseni]|uniref:Uncharacterized protein n=1 Tax=Perkinsus olseni TaxID=32597 RepID=A0A7J6U476_PEROL|nr:hypothetical protein FOZ63_020558 [Perkinsus olseni]KAF4752323.1 hypothetical protein FOZ62_005997 [Perkinsus olseni]